MISQGKRREGNLKGNLTHELTQDESPNCKQEQVFVTVKHRREVSGEKELPQMATHFSFQIMLF